VVEGVGGRRVEEAGRGGGRPLWPAVEADRREEAHAHHRMWSQATCGWTQSTG
jgi:hypothetical protein